MNKWRPEGWKSNYYHDDINLKDDCGDAGAMFEAGADAMLEAIRKEIEGTVMKEDELNALFRPFPRSQLQMRWFEAVAGAQTQKILSLLGGQHEQPQ